MIVSFSDSLLQIGGRHVLSRAYPSRPLRSRWAARGSQSWSRQDRASGETIGHVGRRGEVSRDHDGASGETLSWCIHLMESYHVPGSQAIGDGMGDSWKCVCIPAACFCNLVVVFPTLRGVCLSLTRRDQCWAAREGSRSHDRASGETLHW